MSLTKNLALANIILTAVATFYMFYLASKGFVREERCEHCMFMIFPGLVSSSLLLMGVSTIFYRGTYLRLSEIVIRIINISGIAMSALFILFLLY